MTLVDKDRPSRQWIEQIRRRFPCEREIDRVLTRKLEQRAGPPFTPPSLESLRDGTQRLLRSQLRTPFELRDACWLSGGASKLQMSFTLEWEQPGVGPQVTPLVLRMQPAEAISETSRLREFQMIKAMDGVVPVPPAYWIDADAEFLPHPSIVYGFVNGVAKPTQSSGGLSGVGTFMPPAIRDRLGGDFVDYLAKIHTFDWQRAELSAFDAPEPGLQAAEWNLNHWERVWEEDANEDVPLMRLAMNWLRRNVPPIDRLSVVHGDYRVGNFLFTEPDFRISAWLDWELAYIGDRHEDITWAIKPIFGHRHEDGTTPLVGGFMPLPEFLDRYERASGLPVNAKTLQFYDIFNSYKVIAITLATGHRASRNGKTHQDVLVGWLSGIAYTFLQELRGQLEKAL